MIIAHYAHRLPRDYDIGLIRSRAKQRGALWDSVPELYFKAFLLRENGQHGAIASNYSSLYLWRQDEAFRDFLISGRYGVVTDSFGRAEIRTWFALDARKGKATGARFAYKEDLPVPLDADLKATLAHEIERNEAIGGEADTVAAVVGIDPKTWTLTRLRLSIDEPSAQHRGSVAYEILHLAHPLLDALPGRSPQ